MDKSIGNLEIRIDKLEIKIVQIKKIIGSINLSNMDSVLESKLRKYILIMQKYIQDFDKKVDTMEKCDLRKLLSYRLGGFYDITVFLLESVDNTQLSILEFSDPTKSCNLPEKTSIDEATNHLFYHPR
jgi:hypothetical protein